MSHSDDRLWPGLGNGDWLGEGDHGKHDGHRHEAGKPSLQVLGSADSTLAHLGYRTAKPPVIHPGGWTFFEAEGYATQAKFPTRDGRSARQTLVSGLFIERSFGTQHVRFNPGSWRETPGAG